MEKLKTIPLHGTILGDKTVPVKSMDNVLRCTYVALIKDQKWNSWTFQNILMPLSIHRYSQFRWKSLASLFFVHFCDRHRYLYSSYTLHPTSALQIERLWEGGYMRNTSIGADHKSGRRREKPVIFIGTESNDVLKEALEWGKKERFRVKITKSLFLSFSTLLWLPLSFPPSILIVLV